MARSEGLGRGSTRLLSPLIALLGAAIIVRTLIAGGGVASAGVVLGVIFLLLGAGRFYLSLRASS